MQAPLFFVALYFWRKNEYLESVGFSGAREQDCGLQGRWKHATDVSLSGLFKLNFPKVVSGCNLVRDPVSCSGGVFSGRWLGFRESVR